MSDMTDECWLYAGYIVNEGYGIINTHTKRYTAHRVIYEMEVGPIPEGLVLDHLCRVRRCINPAHLEPVTEAVNILRGVGFSAINAKKTHCPKGHELVGNNILNNGSPNHRQCRICKYATNRAWAKRKREASS